MTGFRKGRNPCPRREERVLDCKSQALDVDADGIDGEVRSNERTLSRRGFAKAALLAGIGMA